MVNAASGVSIVNKIALAAKERLSELAEGSRQFSRWFGTRHVIVEGSSYSKLEDQVQALTSMMREFIVKEKTYEVKACGICS